MSMIRLVFLLAATLTFLSSPASAKDVDDALNRAKADYEAALQAPDAKKLEKAAKRYFQSAAKSLGPWATETGIAARAYGRTLKEKTARSLAASGLRTVERKGRLDQAYLKLMQAAGWADIAQDTLLRLEVLKGVIQTLEGSSRSKLATPFVKEASILNAANADAPLLVYVPSLKAPKRTAAWGAGSSMNGDEGGGQMAFATSTTAGCAKVSFLVSTDGHVRNISVIGLQGPSYFATRATEAAAAMRYLPKMENGYPVVVDNITYLLDWPLAEVVGKGTSSHFKPQQKKETSVCTLR